MMGEQPCGEYPALFFQLGKAPATGDVTGDAIYVDDGPRIRIVYPDGKIEWMSLAETVKVSDDFIEILDHIHLHGEYPDTFNYVWDRTPCYIIKKVLDGDRPKTFFEAVALINAFDTEHGYPPQEFICEL